VSERAEHANLILRAAVAAADAAPAVLRAVHGAQELGTARRIHVIAIGKAAAVMANAAFHALPRTPDSALVIVPHGVEDGPMTHGAASDVMNGATGAHMRASPLRASHPIPDASSAAAAVHVERRLSDAAAGDVVLVLISGGASSLCAAPAAGITIDEYAQVVRGLMHAGADIRELNTLRTHIDRLKGGGMARLIAPARAIGLVVSDVIGNPLDIIASGPLTPCTTTAGDAARILERFGLWSATPHAVRHALTSVHARQQPARHRADAAASAFPHVRVLVVLDNRAAVDGAAREARRLGYDVRVSDEAVTGSAREAGSRIAREARYVADRMRHADPPVCLLYGGETTVTVSGTGTGGRNQELVLAAAIELDGKPRITVASLGTDGIDGPTGAAGAIADGRTVSNGRRAHLNATDALVNNDSHTFFVAAGGLIRTGPTGTNVMDVQLALIDPAAP
jgi:glycerate 2-kinase